MLLVGKYQKTRLSIVILKYNMESFSLKHQVYLESSLNGFSNSMILYPKLTKILKTQLFSWKTIEEKLWVCQKE